MNLYSSKLWLSDLDEIITSFPEMEALEGKSIMITGCTGLICSAVVDLLVRWNIKHKGKIRVLAAGRDKSKISERFFPYDKEEWFNYVHYDASSTDNALTDLCDYIIHGASNASPNKIVNEPVETMLSNFIGVKYLLDYAKKVRATRLLYISSSEIYGMKEGTQPYKTNEYGYIDLLNARSSYSVGKRAAETLCVSYFEEYGVDSVIIRPGHIYGPTAVATDNRVSSAWSYAAAREEEIVMKSNGSQIRSYCYCLDCAAALLSVLLKGETVHAYNISNPDSIISIRQMAEILSESADVGLRITAPSKNEKMGYNPMSNSSLDSEALLALGWRGQFDAKRGFSHTVKILKEMDTF